MFAREKAAKSPGKTVIDLIGPSLERVACRLPLVLSAQRLDPCQSGVDRHWETAQRRG